MGGHALSFTSVRLPADRYRELCRDVCERIESQGGRVEPVKAYRAKLDFGDLDILAWHEDPEEVIRCAFEPREIVPNASVFSFDWQGFQIDWIQTASADWDLSRTYLAFNDLGNLMGRVARSLGCRYGTPRGLTRSVRRLDGAGNEIPAEEISEVTLSREPQRIFAFLGYDFKRFEAGFERLEDVFEFAISSPFACQALFALESLDHANRVRNRKRDSYRKFLEWLPASGLRLGSCGSLPDAGLDRIQNHFPELDFAGRAASMRTDDSLRRKARARLVGALRARGIEGPALGEALISFKSRFPSELEFAEFLSNVSDDQLSRLASELTQRHPAQASAYRPETV